MQKTINVESLGKRQCCPGKSTTAMPKKHKKKLVDNSKSVNKSCSRRGQSSSRDQDPIKVRDFNESAKKLTGTNCKTFEKLGCITNYTKPNNMHSYRLSVTRELCKENKQRQAAGSMRNSDMFSPEHIPHEKVLLERTRNLEEERTTLHQELETLKRSEMNLIRVNESLSQQLVNAQRTLEGQFEKLAVRDKKYHEELTQLRTELHQERSKGLDLNGRLSVLQVEKDSAQRQLQSLQQQLVKDRSSITQLQISVSSLKQRLLHEQTSNNLKAKDAESSTAKVAEELSCKYIKEIAGIEQHHREAVKKLEQAHNQELESMRGQWKQELLNKENELTALRMQLSSANQKISLKLREVQASASERELFLKNLQRKFGEASSDAEQLRKKIEQLNKEKVDLTLKTENKDDIVKQAQRTAEQLAAKLQQVEYDKEEYYEAVIESRERIEQLLKEIANMLEEEDEFMGRFECIASKVVLLQTHIKMDNSIRAQLQERIDHLQQSNKLLQEQANNENAATYRQREDALKQSDDLKMKVIEYRGRWQTAQQKVKKLERDLIQLEASHQLELSNLQNKVIYAAHVKKLDKEAVSANENIHQSSKGSARNSYGRSTGDILSQYDANYRRE